MSHETAAIPRGILGESVDQLLLEREDLAERHKELYEAWEEAERAVGPARRADQDEYAKQLRKADGKDPGRLNTGLAEAALDDAARALRAMEVAFQANQDDITSVLENRRDEIRRLLDDEAEQVRTKALDDLENASKGLMRFGELEALRAWCEEPTNQSGEKLRPFVAQPLRVELRGKNGEFATANAAFVLLGERLEAGSIDAVNLRAAREAGVPADRVEHIAGMALSTGGRIKIQDVAKLGLTRYRLTLGGFALDLICTVEEVEKTTLVDIFRATNKKIDAARKQNEPHVYASDEVKRRIDSVSIETSVTTAAREQQAAEYEDTAEVAHLREKQEAAAAA